MPHNILASGYMNIARGSFGMLFASFPLGLGVSCWVGSASCLPRWAGGGGISRDSCVGIGDTGPWLHFAEVSRDLFVHICSIYMGDQRIAFIYLYGPLGPLRINCRY